MEPANARADDIQYFYTSRLSGEPASGVDDVHAHPSSRVSSAHAAPSGASQVTVRWSTSLETLAHVWTSGLRRSLAMRSTVLHRRRTAAAARSMRVATGTIST
jgi:hypothetical protein